MTTLTTQAEVLPNGHLVLDIPCALPPGTVNVQVIITENLPEPAKRIGTMEGCMAGKFPADLDIDAVRHELRDEWYRSLLRDL